MQFSLLQRMSIKVRFPFLILSLSLLEFWIDITMLWSLFLSLWSGFLKQLFSFLKYRCTFFVFLIELSNQLFHFLALCFNFPLFFIKLFALKCLKLVLQLLNLAIVHTYLIFNERQLFDLCLLFCGLIRHKVERQIGYILIYNWLI